MSYKVFLAEYIGVPRNHHAIFVELVHDGEGEIYQVIGDILTGMQHERKDVKRPDKSASYMSMEQIGTVSHENYDRIESIVFAIEAPKKQFDGPKRLNPREPLRRCQEWTKEAIQALKDANVLED
jgi:hypothetical protein